MTQYVLSIDPGISSGISLISYEADKAPKLEGAWQFTGGVKGLLRWLDMYYVASDYDDEWGNYYPAAINPSDRRFQRGLRLEDVTADQYNEETDEYEEVIIRPRQVTVICEKFNARNNGSFGYTTASLEPLRCEGALIALDLTPDYTPKEKRWRDPTLQYLVGGKDLADKKKRQHAFLKDIGFYRTNKDFPDSPSKDGADDFRSSAAHGLSYLAREVGHKTTWDLIRGWGK